MELVAAQHEIEAIQGARHVAHWAQRKKAAEESAKRKPVLRRCRRIAAPATIPSMIGAGVLAAAGSCARKALRSYADRGNSFTSCGADEHTPPRSGIGSRR